MTVGSKDDVGGFFGLIRVFRVFGLATSVLTGLESMPRNLT